MHETFFYLCILSRTYFFIAYFFSKSDCIDRHTEKSKKVVGFERCIKVYQGFVTYWPPMYDLKINKKENFNPHVLPSVVWFFFGRKWS